MNVKDGALVLSPLRKDAEGKERRPRCFVFVIEVKQEWEKHLRVTLSRGEWRCSGCGAGGEKVLIVFVVLRGRNCA